MRMICFKFDKRVEETRPDTWLPKSRAGGQGPYFRSFLDLDRSSEAKARKKEKRIVAKALDGQRYPCPA